MDSASITLQELQPKDFQYGTADCGKHGDVLVRAVSDLQNILLVVSHPACAMYRRAAPIRPGSPYRTAEDRKQSDHHRGTGHRFVPFAKRVMSLLAAAMDLLKLCSYRWFS